MQEQAEEEERLKLQDAIDGKYLVIFFTAINVVSFEAAIRVICLTKSTRNASSLT